MEPMFILQNVLPTFLNADLLLPCCLQHASWQEEAKEEMLSLSSLVAQAGQERAGDIHPTDMEQDWQQRKF